MAKRKSYTDKFRADCVVMLTALGYPGRKGALTEVSNSQGVPAPTIHRWFHEKNNPAPSELVTTKKEELADVFEYIAYKYLKHAARPEIVEELSGKDAVIAAATATDKMRLLRGLPTEIIQLIPDVILAIEKMGQKPSDVFERIIQRAKEHAPNT